MAGAMASTLCAVSKKVSAQEKKCIKAKAKPPEKSDLLWITKSTHRRIKNSHMHTLQYKTKTQSWSSSQINLQFLKLK